VTRFPEEATRACILPAPEEIVGFAAILVESETWILVLVVCGSRAAEIASETSSGVMAPMSEGVRASAPLVA